MLYDLPHFRIDRSDFMKGSNTSDDFPDGGITYSSVFYNIYKHPGWLTINPAFTNPATSTRTKMGFSSAYGKGTIAQNIMVVSSDGNSDAFFNTYATGGVHTEVNTDSGRDYTPGKIDSIFYKGSFYTTSDTDVAKNSASLGTFDASWWVTTKGMSSFDSFSPHPQVVYGDIHYIADGRYIHQDDNGTVQYDVLDLGQDWVITAMANYNNLIYIAAEPYYNYSGTTHGQAKIFTWDGYSDSFLDEYITDYSVKALYVFKNILYVWTNAYMGYFDGAVVRNLYPLSQAGGERVFKCKIATTENSLWFADGLTLIRYGAPTPGAKYCFSRYAQFSGVIYGIVSDAPKSLTLWYDNGTGSSTQFLTDVDGDPGGNVLIAFNPRSFPRPVKMRGYVVHYDSLQQSGYLEFSYNDESKVIAAQGTKQINANTDAAVLGTRKRRINLFLQKPTSIVYPRILIAGAQYIKYVDFLFEPVEDPINA